MLLFDDTRSARRAEGAGFARDALVAQLVLSTQKAEPQEALRGAAAARSAAPPEHAIANRLFIPFLLKF